MFLFVLNTMSSLVHQVFFGDHKASRYPPNLSGRRKDADTIDPRWVNRLYVLGG